MVDTITDVTAESEATVDEKVVDWPCIETTPMDEVAREMMGTGPDFRIKVIPTDDCSEAHLVFTGIAKKLKGSAPIEWRIRLLY